ncbi:MAG: hypothetical protein P8J91_05665 [Pirellulaceae bacterium]|nr:hypothetical protein [Pirellulaceae bacterium]MDG2103219.1 hypothetical protein [Pirellulaceae bacterium]
MKFSTMSAFTTELIINLVRNTEIMSLEQAHWRLSGYLPPFPPCEPTMTNQ